MGKEIRVDNWNTHLWKEQVATERVFETKILAGPELFDASRGYKGWSFLPVAVVVLVVLVLLAGVEGLSGLPVSDLLEDLRVH